MGRGWTGFGQNQLRRGYRIKKRKAKTASEACSAFKKSVFKKRASAKCHYCGKKLTRKTATTDHFLAKSRGGSNKKKNFRIACRPCNQQKGTMSAGEFAEIQRKTS